jgi:hypothetical protein
MPMPRSTVHSDPIGLLACLLLVASLALPQR